MKKLFPVVSLLFFSAALFGQAPVKVNPVIKSFGSVYAMPDAEEKPDRKMDYKILVDITDIAEKPDSLNAYLEAVATLYNLHAEGGVPVKNIHIVVVIHKMAGYSFFTNERFQQKFKTNNPNIPLITELSNAGVKFFICGQNLLKAKITKDYIVPEVKVATSALTVLTTYQLKGYARINFK
jgi:intracellular sulfur oxidation DsrE/DsrF family protein